MTLAIGAHPSNLTLTALANRAELQAPLRDAGVATSFHWFAEGRLLQQPMATGEINVAGTGSTRGVVAQADGLSIRYIAASRPRATWASILVPANSAIAAPADLVGRRVGLIDGSFQTSFLVAVLDRAGLAYTAVTPVDLPPKTSRERLLDGTVDAWVAMDPYLTAAVADARLRLLVGCDGYIPNRSVFWVTEPVAGMGPGVVGPLVTAIAGTDRWIGSDPARAGRLFADVIGGGVSAEDWAAGVAKREWGIVAADAEVLAEQQAEADLLARHGLLARRIDVGETALPYPVAIP